MTRVGAVQRTRSNRRRVTKGYSAGRQAYDRRRRRHPFNAQGKAFKQIVQHDVCSYCGARPGEQRTGRNDHDHIVPLSDGGDNIWENLAGVCESCNRSKGNRSLLEFLLDA